MIPNSCRQGKEILDYKGWSWAARVGRRVVGTDDPYQLGLWLKESWNFLVLSEVQSFSQSQVSGQMSVVYHLFTVWFLIFTTTTTRWIIQSVAQNLWMVQSDNLGDLFFSSFCLQLIATQIIYYSHPNLLLPWQHSLRSTLDHPKYFPFLGFEENGLI